jgi:hypothetical protein
VKNNSVGIRSRSILTKRKRGQRVPKVAPHQRSYSPELEVEQLVPHGYTVLPQHLVLSGLCPKGRWVEPVKSYAD